jgi:hypothetical protein
VEEKLGLGIVRIHVEVVDPGCIESRSPSNQAVNFITLLEQKFGKV